MYHKKLASFVIQIFLFSLFYSCQEPQNDLIENQNRCRDISWDEILNDSTFNFECELMIIFEEPCVFENSLVKEDSDNFYRLIIYNRNDDDTSHIYRATDLGGCTSLILKSSLSFFFNVLRYYETPASRYNSYQFSKKITDSEALVEIKRIFENIDFNTQREFNTDGDHVVIEMRNDVESKRLYVNGKPEIAIQIERWFEGSMRFN